MDGFEELDTRGKHKTWFTERLNLRTTLLHINSAILRLPKNRIVSLWNIFIILQLGSCCAARDLDRYGMLSNSRYAIDDASGLRDGRVADDITRKSIYLYAVVGHHFNRSLFEEIKAFHRNVLSPGHKLRVSWVCLRDNVAALLQNYPQNVSPLLSLVSWYGPSKSQGTCPSQISNIDIPDQYTY